jgi:hypothetical protein
MVSWAFPYGKSGDNGPAQDDQANGYYPGNQHNLYLDRHGLPARSLLSAQHMGT